MTFDPFDYEEPDDAAVRRRLGLRPVFVPEWTNPAPDTCPSWCCIKGEPFDHELDTERPADVTHSLGSDVYIGASLYPATDVTRSDEHPAGSALAELGVELTQIGADAPTIKVSLNGDGPRTAMEVTIPEARELMVVLGYLADLADGEVPA